MKNAEKQALLLKLMVLAINEAIRRGAIDLEGKSVSTSDKDKGGYIEATLGGKRVIINWWDSGYDELRVSIWWDFQPELMPTWRKNHPESLTSPIPSAFRRYFRYILGACGSCYLERKTGKFIVGEEGNQFFDVYVREGESYRIGMIEPEKPMGYETSGFIPL